MSEIDTGAAGIRFASLWLGQLFNELNALAPDEVKKRIMRGCAQAHYRQLNMHQVIAPYQGDLERFLQFLEHTWDWKITISQDGSTILADENKPECVCPLVQSALIEHQTLLCHCSEGFAEQMFSSVVGQPVEATVLRSIMRGDPSCVYQVRLPAVSR